MICIHDKLLPSSHSADAPFKIKARPPTPPPTERLTVEADGPYVAEQLLAVDVVGHVLAEAGVSVATLAVHAVQGVSHGVHSVHDELHLALLLVAGVPAHLL